MEVSHMTPPPVFSQDKASFISTKEILSTEIAGRKTVFKETISALSDPLSSLSSISSLIPLLTIAYQAQTKPQERLLTLLYTMSPEMPRTYTHEEKVNSFIRFLGPVLSGMAGMTDFREAVEKLSQPDDFCDFWLLEGRNLMTDFVQNGGNGRRMDGFDIPFLDVFIKDPSCRIGFGRERGEMILVPGTSRVGSEVWLERSTEPGA